MELSELKVPSRRQEPLYNFHDVQFRSIIPEETWIKILNMLEQEDKESCVNASPYFWELLQKERVVFLFPRTFEVIALVFEQKYNVRNLKLSTSNEPYVDESFDEPEELDDAWNGIVFNSRLVCTTWNKGVERCYESPAMSGIPELIEELDPRSKLNNLRAIKLNKERFNASCWMDIKLDVFKDKLGPSHFLGDGLAAKNPFLGRYLIIKVFAARPVRSIDITNLLELFGKEVWYLELNFQDNPTYMHYIYKILRTWLWLVPNLKFLQIHFKHRVFAFHHTTSENERHQLPKLEKLQVLYLKGLPVTICEELIRNNSHVSKITNTDMHETDEIFFRNLESLERSESVHSRAVGEMLDKLTPPWEKIDKLKFERDYGDRYYRGSRAHGFNNVQVHWAHTLTELYLDHPFGFDNETTLKESRNCRLRLYAVRKLAIVTANLLFFLDFAVKFRHSLEHLDIQWDSESIITQKYQEKMEKEQVIQLFGFENRMHMSNIWEFFDKLKTIKMRTACDFFTIFTNAKEKIHYKLKSNTERLGNLWPSQILPDSWYSQ